MTTRSIRTNKRLIAIIVAVILTVSEFPMMVFADTDIEMTRLEFKSGTVNLNKAASQKTGGYDTVQGCCANNGYGYFALYNRNNYKVKLVKVKLSNMKVVKVSSAMKLYHANSLTFNTKTSEIICANGTPDATTVTAISPDDLTVLYNITITMPDYVPGMTDNARNEYNGINAIAYNAERDVYVARGKYSNDFLILDENFYPIECIVISGKVKMTHQGLDTYGDYTLDCQSFKDDRLYNQIIVRDWSGQVVDKYNIPIGKGLEFEEVCHDGDDFYSSFYYSTRKKKKKKYVVNRYSYVYSMDNIDLNYIDLYDSELTDTDIYD